jgi:hypothetical protein
MGGGMEALDDDIQVAIRISLEEENQRRLLEQQRLAGNAPGDEGQPGQRNEPMAAERTQPREYTRMTQTRTHRAREGSHPQGKGNVN